MIDPITAISVATNAFGTIQRMVQAGKGVEDTLSQLGRWYGAVADLNEHKRRAENPPLFKRIIASKSVEQEALEIYAHEKKIKQQESELRELLMYTYGPEGYKELVALRRKIKDQREKTVYLQARKRKAFFWNSIQVVAIVCLIAATYSIYNIIVGLTHG
jgi:GrpB-like predicted nucleotidyltransferase (UPF0157 family)